MTTSAKIDLLLLWCAIAPADKRFLLKAKGLDVLTSEQVAMITHLLHKYRHQHKQCDCKLCKAEGTK